MSIDQIPQNGSVVISANGLVRSFSTDRALTDHVISISSPSYVLDVLASHAEKFIGNPVAVTALEELAKRIVAECVAAKLTEEDQPKLAEIPKQTAAMKQNVGLGSALGAGLVGVKWSNDEMQDRLDRLQKQIEAQTFRSIRQQFIDSRDFGVLAIDPKFKLTP